MPQAVAPGTTVPITIGGLGTGLVGSIGIRLENEENEIIVARWTTGFVELGVGIYLVNVTMPNTEGYVFAIADAGGKEASETYYVTRDLPLGAIPGDEPAWRPTTAEVAALIPARVQEPGIGRVSDFSADTNPSKTEIEGKITIAMRRTRRHIVHAEACESADAAELQALREDAGAATAILAAMLTEQGYWPEQSTTAGSSFKSLETLWESEIVDIEERAESICPGDGDTGPGAGDGGNLGGLPKAGEPECGGVIGRESPAW